MPVTSMLFLFLFLPLSLGIYYVANDRAREYVLLAISLLFYSLGSPEYLLLFITASLVTVAIGRVLFKTERKGNRRILLALGVVINIGLLGYYKYSDLAVSTVNRIGGYSIGSPNLSLPLGISFFVFKAISYLADIYSGKIVVESPVHDVLYLSFFAQVQSGPLSRYNDMRNVGVSGGPDERIKLFTDGVIRFMIGYSKKILLANVLAHIANEVFSSPFDRFSVSYAWLGAISYSLQIFFDFAGYSDMAIGLSGMFGYRCMENFNYPYLTRSVSEFWRRWHISLSQWFRDYVYIPLGGSRSGHRYKVYFNLLAVWLLTGIWHGASWRFVAWGSGYFILIALERATGFPERFKTRVGKFVYRIFTLMFINFQWVIFRADSLRTALLYIKCMFFCGDNALADMRTRFLIKDYLGFLVFAIALCFPIVPWIGKKLENKETAHTIYEISVLLIVAALFVWAVSFVVSGQNDPFVYADF
ncbi:MAG: MBOAT family protein [Eubacterium sp.]|nr:MBOAT family protein [Eubacterium sp.]